MFFSTVMRGNRAYDWKMTPTPRSRAGRSVTSLPWSMTRPESGRSSPAMMRRIVVKNIDRKSTRLNSRHSQISYAVFCLKKHNFARSADVRGQRLSQNSYLKLLVIDPARAGLAEHRPGRERAAGDAQQGAAERPRRVLTA